MDLDHPGWIHTRSSTSRIHGSWCIALEHTTALVLQRACTCPSEGPLAHTPRSTIAPACYIPLGCPTRIPTPDHTIPLHGLDGPTPSVTTTLRIVALQGPSRGTPAATSVARDERRKPAADALRDLVPGDLQHLASREYQGLQTLRLSGSTIPPRGIMASACLLGRPTAST